MSVDVAVENRVQQSQGLVRALALQIHRKLPSHVNFDDVLSYGQLGLLQAAQSFREDSGTAFQTFAYYRIRGAIYDGISKMTWKCRPVSAPIRAARQSDEILEEQSQRPHDGTSYEDDCQWLVQTTQKLAFVQFLSTSGDQASDQMQSLADRSESPDQEVAGRELQEVVRKLVDQLPEVEQQLIRLIYYEGKSLTEVAELMGKSKSWASRLHTSIVERLARSSQLSAAS